MNKQDIIDAVAHRHNVILGEDDPTLIAADILMMHVDEIQDILIESKTSLPYLLELKRQEIDNTAMKLLNAGEILHQEQKVKIEMIELQSNRRLIEHSDALVENILLRISSGMESKVEQTINSATYSLERLASTIKTQHDQDVKNRNKDRWLYIGCGLFSGVFGGLVFFTLLIFTGLI
jgi:hypothetical protein